MPTICYRSVVKEAEEGFIFTLKAQHRLVVGTNDEPTKIVGRLPAIDVVLDADLVLSVSGVHQKKRICGERMKKSFPVQHLSTFLKSNASELGLSNVSDVYIDREDDLAKMTLSSAHAYIPENSAAKLYLRSIELVYHFQPEQAYEDTSFDIFTEQTYLPYNAILDRVLEKFMDKLFRCDPRFERYLELYTLQVVSFNLRALAQSEQFVAKMLSADALKKLGAESTFSLPLSRSLSRIIHRSKNPLFRKACKRIIEELIAQCQAAEEAASQDLANIGIEFTNQETPQTERNAEILNLSMLQLLRLQIKPPRFKAFKRTRTSDVIAAPFELAYEDPMPSEDDTVSPSNALKWEDLPLLSESLCRHAPVQSELRHERADDDCYDDYLQGDIENLDDRLSEASLELHIQHEDADHDSIIDAEYLEDSLEGNHLDDPMDAFDTSTSSFQTNSTMPSSSQESLHLQINSHLWIRSFISGLAADEERGFAPFMSDRHNQPTSEGDSDSLAIDQDLFSAAEKLQDRLRCDIDDAEMASPWSSTDYDDDFDWLSEIGHRLLDDSEFNFDHPDHTLDEHDLLELESTLIS